MKWLITVWIEFKQIIKLKSEILKNKLKNLLEDYIYEDLTNKSYKKNIILARDLISSNRIDLGFRILFLELKKRI